MNSHVKVYDSIAPEYDSRYTDESCQLENKAVAEIVKSLHPNPKLLDVGCGTGLALELGLVNTGKYVGLDPSEGMLQRMREKFPEENLRLVQATFEDAYDRRLVRRGFDVMISLFGSPSYVAPSYMENMISMANHGVVMHYLPGYWPDYEHETPYASRSLALAERAVLSRGGKILELNNFQVGVY